MSTQNRSSGDELEVLLGLDGSSVSGNVTDRDDHPIPNASVILMADPLPMEFAPNQVLTRATDASGRFDFNSLAPGNYVVAAFTGLPSGQEYSPETINATLISFSNQPASAKR